MTTTLTTLTALQLIVRDGPACPKCGAGTVVIGELNLAEQAYDYFRCRVCKHVGDTRPTR